jgi:hypothetical protein
MSQAILTCQSEARRERVRRSTLMGLDYLEVSSDQLTLTVYLLGQAPKQIKPANLQISGGERITAIQVTSITVQPETDYADAFLTVKVDKYGDFSPYTLSAVELDDQGHPTQAPMSGFDPRYAAMEFSFKAGCPSDLDCKNQAVCPTPNPVEPEINYLAKDYASFRQVILDRLSVLMPDWQETHVPDIGIMLIEVLAYVGDYLSYYQDAVATEAYLDTARQRISVRRHARLVDYQMHEGCNARAWVTICASDSSPLTVPPQDIRFSTELQDGNTVIFEPVTSSPGEPLHLFVAHNKIKFYTWGNKLCCLPAGATQATLLDFSVPSQAGTSQQTPGPATRLPAPSATAEPKRGLQLNVGDVLIFEEVLGPKTGSPSDADPSRRWPVRLTRVTPTEDPLKTKEGQTTPIVEIAWAVQDALPFPFCLSARLPAPDCGIVCDISVARGNVILVDHGLTISPPEALGQVGLEEETGTCECEGSAVDMTSSPAVFRPLLQNSPLTFCDTVKTGLPASQMLIQDPAKALPQISLNALAGVCPQPGDAGPPKPIDGATPQIWLPVPDLLESGSLDHNFVVEIDNDAVAHLRFGDGELGRMPDACTIFQATYRVGNGTAGNVGADAITTCSNRDPSKPPLNLKSRNPLPAQGGTDPEPMANVKLFAPGAFKKVLERAITATDYAAIAERNPKVQQADGTLRWTGSWYEAQVAVDPLGTETADAGLLQEINGYLHRFRRIGHDLAVIPARYVPLDIAMTICVLPQYLRGHVEKALLDVFSNRALPNGQLGFFHPDNLTFGQGIYLSKLVAAAQAVTGVQSVMVTKLQRLYSVPEGIIDKTALDSGVLVMNPSEVAQLDNDPSFPEHGRLKLTLGGGR